MNNPMQNGMPTASQAKAAGCEFRFGRFSIFVLQRSFARKLVITHPVFLIDRFDKKIADEAAKQKERHHVEREVVDLVMCHALIDLKLAKASNQRWAGDASDRPSNDKSAMDGADHLRSKNISEIRGGKSAPVHDQNNTDRQHE
jgi:hypothetical protein